MLAISQQRKVELSADHLTNLIHRVLNTNKNTLITLPGHGDVSIFPKMQAYIPNMRNMQEFLLAPTSAYIIKDLDHVNIDLNSTIVKHINDLLWCTAFYTYKYQLIESCSKNDIIQLKKWPNLTRLPLTKNTARIVALLTRYPTSIMLVHRILDIDIDEANQVISAAYAAGLVSKISHGRSLALDLASQSIEAKQSQSRNQGLWKSLFRKVSSL
jgi:hypothetical protein